MDTSQEYVNMCVSACELQDRWKPAPCDYIFCRVDNCSTYLLPVKPANKLNNHWLDGDLLKGSECQGFKVEHVWLPRQDQLQAALLLRRELTSILFCNFSRFVYHKNIKSPEQLWLRYYMSRRHKKDWLDKEWCHSVGRTYGQK